MHPVTQMIRCYLEPVEKPKSSKGKDGNNEPREDQLQQKRTASGRAQGRT
jgi:hypothetical protein